MCSIKGRIVIQMSFNRFNWYNHTWLKWLVYSPCVFPLYFVVPESIYGYFSWVLLQPRFVLSYPFNETHKMAINRLQKHKRKKETHNLSDISQLFKDIVRNKSVTNFYFLLKLPEIKEKMHFRSPKWSHKSTKLSRKRVDSPQVDFTSF